MFNKEIHMDIRTVYLIDQLKCSKARSFSQVTCFICNKEIRHIEASQRKYIRVNKLRICYFCALRILSHPFFYVYLEKFQDNKPYTSEDLIHLRLSLPIFLNKNHLLLKKIMQLRNQENESMTILHLNRLLKKSKNLN